VDKPEDVIRVLPMYISSKNITSVAKDLGFDIMSVKHMTGKRPSPEDVIPLVFTPLA
jgi:hypothetical protein